jgi:hypothetical protein
VRNGKIAEYISLDKSIGAKHLADLESMKKAASTFTRVKVNYCFNNKVIHKGTDEVPPMNRCYEAFHYFSDLQTSVQNSFPGFDCILKVSGTDDIVASQSELLFAYMDKVQEAPVLLLELGISKSVKKRKKRDDVLFPNADNISATKRDGPWENGEIELFKAGVKVALIINNRNTVGENGIEFRSILNHEIPLKFEIFPLLLSVAESDLAVFLPKGILVWRPESRLLLRNYVPTMVLICLKKIVAPNNTIFSSLFKYTSFH